MPKFCQFSSGITLSFLPPHPFLEKTGNETDEGGEDDSDDGCHFAERAHVSVWALPGAGGRLKEELTQPF